MGTSLHIQVMGFVGSEPQVRQVGEQTVASFSVAISRKSKAGEKQTQWVRISCWNKLAEVAQQYVKRGSLIQVSASWVRMSAWVDQAGAPQPSLELDASQLVLLDRAENGSAKDEPSGEIPF